MSESKYRTPMTDALFEAILSLQNEEECYRFFEDGCTIKEIRDIALRLEVARQLRQGVTVAAIAQSLGVSTTTVSRVNRCLHYGAGGYDLVLKD